MSLFGPDLTHYSIPDLHPELPSNSFFSGVVRLIWPLSTAAGFPAVTLKVAENDPIKRLRKGEVRVKFVGETARRVYGTGVSIGEEIRVGLEGVEWIASEGSLGAADLGWTVEVGRRGGSCELVRSTEIIPIEVSEHLPEQPTVDISARSEEPTIPTEPTTPELPVPSISPVEPGSFRLPASFKKRPAEVMSTSWFADDENEPKRLRISPRIERSVSPVNKDAPMPIGVADARDKDDVPSPSTLAPGPAGTVLQTYTAPVLQPAPLLEISSIFEIMRGLSPEKETPEIAIAPAEKEAGAETTDYSIPAQPLFQDPFSERRLSIDIPADERRTSVTSLADGRRFSIDASSDGRRISFGSFDGGRRLSIDTYSLDTSATVFRRASIQSNHSLVTEMLSPVIMRDSTSQTGELSSPSPSPPPVVPSPEAEEEPVAEESEAAAPSTAPSLSRSPSPLPEQKERSPNTSAAADALTSLSNASLSQSHHSPSPLPVQKSPTPATAHSPLPVHKSPTPNHRTDIPDQPIHISRSPSPLPAEEATTPTLYTDAPTDIDVDVESEHSPAEFPLRPSERRYASPSLGRRTTEPPTRDERRYTSPSLGGRTPEVTELDDSDEDEEMPDVSREMEDDVGMGSDQSDGGGVDDVKHEQDLEAQDASHEIDNDDYYSSPHEELHTGISDVEEKGDKVGDVDEEQEEDEVETEYCAKSVYEEEEAIPSNDLSELGEDIEEEESKYFTQDKKLDREEAERLRNQYRVLQKLGERSSSAVKEEEEFDDDYFAGMEGDDVQGGEEEEVYEEEDTRGSYERAISISSDTLPPSIRQTPTPPPQPQIEEPILICSSPQPSHHSSHASSVDEAESSPILPDEHSSAIPPSNPPRRPDQSSNVHEWIEKHGPDQSYENFDRASPFFPEGGPSQSATRSATTSGSTTPQLQPQPQKGKDRIAERSMRVQSIALTEEEKAGGLDTWFGENDAPPTKVVVKETMSSRMALSEEEKKGGLATWFAESSQQQPVTPAAPNTTIRRVQSAFTSVETPQPMSQTQTTQTPLTDMFKRSASGPALLRISGDNPTIPSAGPSASAGSKHPGGGRLFDSDIKKSYLLGSVAPGNALDDDDLFTHPTPKKGKLMKKPSRISPEEEHEEEEIRPEAREQSSRVPHTPMRPPLHPQRRISGRVSIGNIGQQNLDSALAAKEKKPDSSPSTPGLDREPSRRKDRRF